MTDTDDALFAARLHINTGTMLSAEVVTEICKAYLALVEQQAEMGRFIDSLARDVGSRMIREVTSGFDANGSETP